MQTEKYNSVVVVGNKIKILNSRGSVMLEKNILNTYEVLSPANLTGNGFTILVKDKQSKITKLFTYNMMGSLMREQCIR